MSEVLGPVKLDFSSYYKFIASVGLLFIATAAALPWFVLRAASPEAPFRSSAARTVNAAIDARAHQYATIVHSYPWVSLTLLICGIVLTSYGLHSWKKRQKAHDSDEDESYKQRRELGTTVKATESEREQKLENEASEAIDDSALPGGMNAEEAPADQTKDALAKSTPNGVTNRYNERRRLIERSESHVAKLIGMAFGETHSIETGVKVKTQGAFFLDVVARSRVPDKWTSFAIEVRLVDSGYAASRRIRDGMLAVAIAAKDVPEGQVQTRSVGRPPVAKSVSICFVVVSSNESRPLSAGYNFTGAVESTVSVMNSVLLRKSGVIVVSESEFERLDGRWLHDRVIEVMLDPEAAVLRL